MTANPITDRPVHWIDVNDHLPDDEITVLICNSDGFVEQGFIEAGEWFWFSGGSVECHVVAWADMPTGPEWLK